MEGKGSRRQARQSGGATTNSPSQQPSLDSLFSESSVSGFEDGTNINLEEGPRSRVIRIPPFHYLHVLNTNNNFARLEVGPKTLTCLDHEKILFVPRKMIAIPPGHYCVIKNGHLTETDPKTGKKKVVTDQYGQVKLKHGDSEIRFEQEPFGLYPGEQLVGEVEPLRIVERDTALRLRATRDFLDSLSTENENQKIERKAGDEWMFNGGPRTYIPQVEVEIVELITGIILTPQQALHLKARRECKNIFGRVCKPGEEWLVRYEEVDGPYIAGVDEIVVRVVNAFTLEKDLLSLHLQAKKTFKDDFGKHRKAGEQWLVKAEDREIHIPAVDEDVIGEVRNILLLSNQYCIIEDPKDEQTGKNLLGQRKLVKGPANFFLQPGEKTPGKMSSILVKPEEALFLRAKEEFKDTTSNPPNVVTRKPGDRWYCYGPREYFPNIEVDIVAKKVAFIQLEGLGIFLFYTRFSFAAFLIFVFVFVFYFFRFLFS